MFCQHKSLVIFLIVFLGSYSGRSQNHIYPLKVSDNRRFLADQNNTPFFLHGDSPWEIVWQFTTEETSEYFQKRAKQGFNTVLINLLPDSKGDGHPFTKNRYGVMPFSNPNDFGTANAAYFDHAEWVVNEAKKNNLLVAFFPCYLGIFVTWSDDLKNNGVEKARAYGKYVAERFKKYPNIIWIMGGDQDPGETMPEQVALAESLHENAPAQLMTFHGREHSSASLFNDANWLDFNFTYSYNETYTQSQEDFRRTPVRPTIMSESGYERESNDFRMGTPQRIRRQAYWTLLSGSCGHFYGSSYWYMGKGWRESINWTGVLNMKICRNFFESIPWYTLVPEFEKQLIVEGNGQYGSNDDYITAAAMPDYSLAVLYMPIARRIRLDLSLFPSKVTARWFNPSTGLYTNASPKILDNKMSDEFMLPPVRDCDGDWVLVLTTIKN